MKSFLTKYWVLIALALSIALCVGAFSYGYRFGPYGLPVKAGEIIVENVPDGSVVYFDALRSHTVRNGSVNFFVRKGSHRIIVDADGFQPWNELISISEGEKEHIRPILVQRTLTKQELPEEDTVQALQTLWSTTLPTAEKPILLSNGCTRVYVSQNRIIAQAIVSSECKAPSYLCNEEATVDESACVPTIIMEPTETLRSVFAYPAREDALIVASGSFVYVLELDPREPRFFAPLAKGVSLRSAPWSETSIIISHENSVRELPL